MSPSKFLKSPSLQNSSLFPLKEETADQVVSHQSSPENAISANSHRENSDPNMYASGPRDANNFKAVSLFTGSPSSCSRKSQGGLGSVSNLSSVSPPGENHDPDAHRQCDV
eukprot:1725570-Rhodomonas_salina.2